MKNVTLFILTALLTQFSFSQTMTVHKNDLSIVTFQLSQIDSITFGLLPFDSLWRATTEYYPETANIDSIVQALFGSNYRVADWNDMVSYSLTHSMEEWANNLGMIYGGYPASGFLVKSGGNRWWSGNRHYWVERHNHVVPGGWLVHDDIDNHFIDLGSWYDMSLRILCIRTN